MIQIDRASFVSDADSAFGTVAVTIDNDTRTLRAWNRGDSITVFGLAVRNGRSGIQAWQGQATLWFKSGNITIMRSGNFRNPSGNGLRLQGFYNSEAKNICEHSSQN